MTKAITSKPVTNPKEIIADVKAYSHKVYLAGLGLYGTTSQQRRKSYNEVVKTSKVIFKDLVKSGEGLEKKAKQLIDEQVKAVNKQINKLTATAKKTIKADAKIVEKAAVKVQAKVAAKKAPVRAAAKPRVAAKA